MPLHLCVARPDMVQEVDVRCVPSTLAPRANLFGWERYDGADDVPLESEKSVPFNGNSLDLRHGVQTAEFEREPAGKKRRLGASPCHNRWPIR